MHKFLLPGLLVLLVVIALMLWCKSKKALSVKEHRGGGGSGHSGGGFSGGHSGSGFSGGMGRGMAGGRPSTGMGMRNPGTGAGHGAGRGRGINRSTQRGNNSWGRGRWRGRWNRYYGGWSGCCWGWPWYDYDLYGWPWFYGWFPAQDPSYFLWSNYVWGQDWKFGDRICKSPQSMEDLYNCFPEMSDFSDDDSRWRDIKPV